MGIRFQLKKHTQIPTCVHNALIGGCRHAGKLSARHPLGMNDSAFCCIIQKTIARGEKKR